MSASSLASSSSTSTFAILKYRRKIIYAILWHWYWNVGLPFLISAVRLMQMTPSTPKRVRHAKSCDRDRLGSRTFSNPIPLKLPPTPYSRDPFNSEPGFAPSRRSAGETRGSKISFNFVTACRSARKPKSPETSTLRQRCPKPMALVFGVDM